MDLPAWLKPLPDAAEQRALDTWAIETLGIPGATLMDRAGTELARITAERVPTGNIALVCGRGNNGGDGQVAARVLRELGRDVTVFDVSQGDAELSRLPSLGQPGSSTRFSARASRERRASRSRVRSPRSTPPGSLRPACG